MLCISKEIFEKLSLTTRESNTQQTVAKDTPAHIQRTRKSYKTLVLPVPNAKETLCPEYIPTKIWPTRDSALWQWRRVKEWHREYGLDEFINEKRHIY
ncbi:MAG: hypothetical protein KKG43_03945 [Candidatus Omnitrophica bacterium]|nr:hypothetical protein [Candidatus Omnitrophota bacterium]